MRVMPSGSQSALFLRSFGNYRYGVYALIDLSLQRACCSAERLSTNGETRSTIKSILELLTAFLKTTQSCFCSSHYSLSSKSAHLLKLIARLERHEKKRPVNGSLVERWRLKKKISIRNKFTGIDRHT